MSQINIRNLSNENDDGSPEIVGVSTFSATSFFVPPKGTTAERPSNCEPGSIRFNTDTANLEYFRGKTLGWSQFELVTPNLGGGTGSNTGVGVRAVISVGQRSPSPYNTDIDFITISTLGNAQDFGDAGVTRDKLASGSDRTRGLFIGGEGVTDTIEFITFASTGNATDFGNISHGGQMRFCAGCSSSTRTIFGGGYTGPAAYNILEYVTTQSTGNSVDYGDLLEQTNAPAACSSSTRGVFAGGTTHNYSANKNTIQFFTMSSTGNTTDYGDLTQAKSKLSGASNSTRGLFFGGDAPSVVNDIDFITIATTGNATDFGDLISARARPCAAASSTRGITQGGTPGINSIEFVEIATTGNAVDFGDGNGSGNSGAAACSNGHGGL